MNSDNYAWTYKRVFFQVKTTVDTSISASPKIIFAFRCFFIIIERTRRRGKSKFILSYTIELALVILLTSYDRSP